MLVKTKVENLLKSLPIKYQSISVIGSKTLYVIIKCKSLTSAQEYQKVLNKMFNGKTKVVETISGFTVGNYY